MIIKKIIDTFRDLSREHKLVRSFEYNRVSKNMGTGEQIYPRVLLEDPIYVGDAKVMDGTVLVTVSFDLLPLVLTSLVFPMLFPISTLSS